MVGSIPNMEPLDFVLAGAGGRGTGFADWLALNVGPGSVVAVAEPDPERRARVARMHEIPPERQFATWQDMLRERRLARALINATMDRDHAGSACAALALGYDMLLEKPLAPNLYEAKAIDEARRRSGRIVSVCHSLRYHAVYSRLRELIVEGAIGEVVSLDQLEAVEHVHQSHSFVRGNWGNERESSFMLLAKSCHDLDIIADIIGEPCLSVSSFGSLEHFRLENAPPGSPAFCVMGCPVQEECPYDAVKIYTEPGFWQSHAGFGGLTRAEILERLRTDRYGRCVYRSNNDVVDHQVVAMRFEKGITATFTMTAFTPWGGRYVRVHGSRGYIEARSDAGFIDMWEFWRGNRHTRVEIPRESGSHGGADDRVMRNFLEALRRDDPELVRTGTEESVRTHSIVFAAEISRIEARMVNLCELEGDMQPLSPRARELVAAT